MGLGEVVRHADQQRILVCLQPYWLQGDAGKLRQVVKQIVIFLNPSNHGKSAGRRDRSLIPDVLLLFFRKRGLLEPGIQKVLAITRAITQTGSSLMERRRLIRRHKKIRTGRVTQAHVRLIVVRPHGGKKKKTVRLLECNSAAHVIRQGIGNVWRGFAPLRIELGMRQYIHIPCNQRCFQACSTCGTSIE